MALLHIAGGVALILFGSRFLRQGLERVFGHVLHEWIERMGRRRWSAAVAGLAFGTVAPSSTAQTLLTMQLLNAGRLPAESLLVFLLGANVGITVTVQLIAFRLFDHAAIFLLVGVAGYLWARRETWKGAGQAVLALGCIFLAMGLISSSARQLTAAPDFQTMMGVLANHRWLLVIFAGGLTFVTQSSTAVIGLVIALADAGACPLPTILPVVLGANLGLGLTSLATGWPTLAGRRLATANLLLKGAIIAGAMLLFPVVHEGVAAMPGGVARQTANFHTGFNLIVALVGAALAGSVGRLVVRAVREVPRPEDLATVATHLEPSALSTPVFALANAVRETLRLTELVKSMLAGCWRGYEQLDAALVHQVRALDDRVDALHAAIKHYLSRIHTEGMTPRDSQLQFGLLHFTSQLESIGDVVDKSLCHQALKQFELRLPLAGADHAELAELQHRVIQRLDSAVLVLTTRDREAARRHLRQGEGLDAWCQAAQQRHYHRLGPDPRALEASTHFLDMFNALWRISGQLDSLGYTFAEIKPRNRLHSGI